MIAEVGDLLSIINTLKKGGVILAPTDTVWGLMCDFENQSAINRMLKLKRAETRPIALLCSNWRKLDSFGLMMPDYASKLARKFWPGPITMVLSASSERIRFVAGAGNTIGIRMPDLTDLLNLIEELGKPVAATSANFTGEQTGSSIAEIPNEIKSGVDAIYEIPVKISGAASTVIDCTGSAYKVIRQGGIRLNDIEKAIRE